MTPEQDVELLAKLERIAVALEAQTDLLAEQGATQAALGAIVERIASALETEAASSPPPGAQHRASAPGTKT